ncbi:MAG: lipocalin family protein [Proteobacteria bacterium]|nr:lipocalin family protein [Pseudomonadota bacterium]
MTYLNRLLIVLTLLLFGSGCQSTEYAEPITTMEYVDLERFAGDWYVLAAIPTFIETEAFDAVETYAPPVDGKIATTFRYRDGGFEGPEKVYSPMGFVREGTGNAVWGMQFVWPIKAEYRIVYVDDNYDYTIIGRTKRGYVWIMSRSSEVADADYQDLVDRVEAEGYDLSKLRRVPHRKIDPTPQRPS